MLNSSFVENSWSKKFVNLEWIEFGRHFHTGNVNLELG